MKIIQFNIYFGDHEGIDIHNRMKNLSKCLIDENADVVCLQEVLKLFYENLCDLLKIVYPYIWPDRKTGLDCEYGTAIFSKHPIKKSIKYNYEFTKMGRDLKLALIENEAKESVYVCTTHFESEFKQGCMKKIYQYKRCADILQRIYKKTKVPVILCADTNICTYTEKIFDTAFSYASGWIDTWIENKFTEPDTSNEYTFDSETNPILIKRYEKSQGQNQKKPIYKSRLDRVLHLSNFHSNDFKLIGTDKTIIISDHYGVSCTFSKHKPDKRPDYDSLIKNIEKTDKQMKPHKVSTKMFLKKPERNEQS
jgi:endonuclease/exonuclease/phosphatase family metal-dependent hydrolase